MYYVMMWNQGVGYDFFLIPIFKVIFYELYIKLIPEISSNFCFKLRRSTLFLNRAKSYFT